MRSTRCWCGWAALVALAVAVLDAGAARPRVWRQESFAAFAAGSADGVSILHEGSLRLAPNLAQIAALDAERVWSLASPVEGTLFVGTGDDGQIFRVDGDGNASLYFDSPEVSIHALAADERGALYAGTAPDGLIYRISPGGEATTLATTGSHYVWDLEFGTGGELFAATGEPAAVLQIDPTGKVDTLAQLQDRHAMALTRVGKRLYASTSHRGRIYEIGEDGSPILLYEAAQEEIHSLVHDAQGNLFAAVVAAGEESDNSAGFTAVLRFHSKTGGRLVWTAQEGQVLGVVAKGDGEALFAVTEPPRVHLLDRSDRTSALIDFEGQTPGRLLRTPSGAIAVGMAQAATVYSLNHADRRRGAFESSVHDFGAHSDWGRIYWHGITPRNTGIELQTRSGNSAEPDDTWSDWSRPQNESGHLIANPAARYLQYRAILKTSDADQTPELHRVEVWARQANLRPAITELQTYPRRDGERLAKNVPEKAGNGQLANNNKRRRNLPQRKSLRVVRWQANDPNGDDLSYDLYLRSLDQQEWKLAEENIPQNSILWDTETMPEGLTLLKLVASDRPDNDEAEALSSEQVTGPFAIDNSPPIIAAEAVVKGDVHVALELRDRISPIRKVQYSVDYNDQIHQVSPLDGVFDGIDERARFTVRALAPGEHVIAIQAWDALDNVGTQQIVVHVEE